MTEMTNSLPMFPGAAPATTLHLGRVMAAVVTFFLMLLPLSAFSQTDEAVDEDFVITSLLVASPGDVLYSRVGHCALRMQCPEHDLDYVFSYESENARQKVLSFLSGRLKMGMFAIPTDDYLSLYREEGRGVQEYRLTLPIDAKRNLWRVLDNHVAEGFYLPYDYLERGCAHSTLMMLREGLDTIAIDYGPWPEHISALTRRELTGLRMKESPWSWCFMNLICNGSIDASCPKAQKAIMPADLVEVLSRASVQGRPVMATSPTELSPCTKAPHTAPWLTPTLVVLLILLLTVVSNMFRCNVMHYVLLTLQTALGLFTCYLVFVSSLCCTEWSWLIIPFNPLPLLFWRWRRYWALPYAVVLVGWLAAMLLSPHTLTDTPYLLLTAALVIDYLSIWWRNRKTTAFTKVASPHQAQTER